VNINTEKTRKYHHGNLRQSLIDAFIALLVNLPAEKISMRRLASIVGVAPAAVYNHFANKLELEVAVKTKCLNHFADYLNGSQLSDSNARERIRDLGIAYFNYSQKHSTYFELIMSNRIQDASEDLELQDASMRSEEALRLCVKGLLEEHAINTDDGIEALGAFACWSLAHGVSTLAKTKVNAAACAMQKWPESLALQTDENILRCFDSMSWILSEGIINAAKNKKEIKL